MAHEARPPRRDTPVIISFFFIIGHQPFLSAIDKEDFCSQESLACEIKRRRQVQQVTRQSARQL